VRNRNADEELDNRVAVIGETNLDAGSDCSLWESGRQECSVKSRPPRAASWQANCVILAAGQLPFMVARNRPTAEVGRVESNCQQAVTQPLARWPLLRQCYVLLTWRLFASGSTNLEWPPFLPATPVRENWRQSSAEWTPWQTTHPPRPAIAC
jgi:hypothetical protein